MCQTNVYPRLTPIHRPGHEAHNCTNLCRGYGTDVRKSNEKRLMDQSTLKDRFFFAIFVVSAFTKLEPTLSSCSVSKKESPFSVKVRHAEGYWRSLIDQYDVF